jgi:hypothetical protein
MIGTKFYRYSDKHKNLEMVIDKYTTINNRGEIVKIVYVTEKEVLGQKVFDYNVAESTIKRSEII